MSQQSLAEAAVEVFNRVDAENQLKSAQEIILDDSNEVAFPGYPYTFEALHEKILVAIDIFKSGYECKECKGKGKVEVKQGRDAAFIDCAACQGRGALMFLPETSKNLPTTGVVVSMGKTAKEKADFKVGDRVLFGAYAGTMIPTKIGLMFKYMDWYLGVVKIRGAESLGAFDFILQADE